MTPLCPRAATIGLVITKASARIAAPLALAAVLTTSGCALMSPVQTDVNYQASDGVNLDLGDRLDVRGLVVVGSDQSDEPGRLAGQFVNGTNEAVAVSFATEGSDKVSTSVPAHASVNLAEADDLVLSAVPGKAGDLVKVTISTSGSGENILDVPVLTADGYYKGLAAN